MGARDLHVVSLDRHELEQCIHMILATRPPSPSRKLNPNQQLCHRDRCHSHFVFVFDQVEDRSAAPFKGDEDRRIKNQACQLRSSTKSASRISLCS